MPHLTGPGRALRLLLFWGLPVAIFYLLFRKVDLGLLRSRVLQADLPLLALGLCVYPFMMLLGAARWNLQLRNHVSDRLRLGQTARMYWMGFPLTLLVPSGLGWDAHRVLSAGRKHGSYAVNVGVIFVEKIIALVAVMLLILAAYPFAVPYLGAASDLRMVAVVPTLLLGGLCGFGLVVLVLRYRPAGGLADRIGKYFTDRIKVVLNALRLAERVDSASSPMRDFLLPMTNPRLFFPVLAWSLAIQVAAALSAQVFFAAVGYDVDFAVNLFVVPFVFLALVLPVSVGGLGIREAAYVVLYGQFGVPVETALLVSFCALLGVLLNHAIGGTLLWLHGVHSPPSGAR